MPHINSRGQVAHGVGGGQASVNNVPFSKGAVGGWITDDLVLFADGRDDSWAASSYDIRTQVVKRLDTACQFSVKSSLAGGGQWAVWGGGRGLRSSTGFVKDDAYPLAVGPDGTLGYKPLYQSGGPTMAREPNGTEWQITSGHAGDLQLLGDRRAIWTDGYIHAVGLTQPVMADGGMNWLGSAAFAGGRWWSSYFSENKGIVLHPFDSFQGFSILPKGDGWHTIRAIDDATILVVVARGEGEQPGEIWGVFIDVKTGIVNDWVTGRTRTDIVLTDVRDINKLVVPDAIHPNVASVQLAGTWVADASAPGNAAIGSPSYKIPEQAVVIAGVDDIVSVPVERLGLLLVYLTGTDTMVREAIARHIPIAKKHRVPMIVYYDGRQSRFNIVKEACGTAPFIWMPQWYLSVGESPEAFARLMKELATDYAGHPFVPVIRGYTSWNGLVDVIPEAAVVTAMNELVRQGALKIDGCLGWIFFAYNRLDGMKNRPGILAAVNTWMQTPTTAKTGRAFADQFFKNEVSMDVPDHSAVVRALFDTGAFKLDSHDGCGIFTDACARALHAVDSNWGHLAKSPGRNQYPDVNGHAVDAVLHRTAGCSVDLISASETPEARPSWGVDIPRYTEADWRDPGPQPKSSIVRPKVPFVVLGMSGFDFCTHRNPAWLDLHVQYGLPFVRLVPQSVYRTPRTLAEGLAQLEAALPLIAAKGLGALVTLNCDTKEYGMSRADVLANTAAMNAILLKHRAKFKPQYLIPDAANENQNGNEQPFMMDPFFLLEVDKLIDPSFPFAWGTMFGTTVSRAAMGGSITMHHSDRGLGPDQNGQIMAKAQTDFGISVWDREPKGFAEPGTPGQRTWDVEFARGLGIAAKQYGLGGLIYHTQAGLFADVTKFGPSHRAGAAALVEGFGGQITPTPGGDDVKIEEIAEVIAGTYFELAAQRIGATGTVEQKRPKVHAWIRERCTALNESYRVVFNRECDLEGFGSRVFLQITQGLSDDAIRQILIKGKAEGAK